MLTIDRLDYPLDIILLTFSTRAFVTPAEPQKLSSSSLRMVEFHTMCLYNEKERYLENILC